MVMIFVGNVESPLYIVGVIVIDVASHFRFVSVNVKSVGLPMLLEIAHINILLPLNTTQYLVY